MRRRLAALLCVAVLLARSAPASARRAHPTPEPAPTDELITALSNPCALTPLFIEFHATITNLSTKAFDAGNSAYRLHHTTMSRPYTHIERTYEEIVTGANVALDKLSILPIALDASPAGPQKKAASALIAADQKTIEHLVDYAHFAVNFERAENNLSQNFQQGAFGFGVSSLLTQAGAANSIRRRFDANNLEAHEAIQALQLPQRRYAAACRVGSPALASGAPKLADPCDLSDQLFAARETLRQMGEEANEAGASVVRLRATSHWRPYKDIEAKWSDIRPEADSLSTTLETFRLSLDPLPDSPKKDATQELIETDATALKRIMAYAEAAVGLERTQNNLSVNTARQYLTFGVSKVAPKMNGDNTARQEFNHVFGEIESVTYSLKIPEYHYAKLCGGSF